ncbi:MAG: MOSC domain-containing protein [Thermoplasmata archaeon]|nr:MOSC domain-containing protein [Thermoplasmata archaeon]
MNTGVPRDVPWDGATVRTSFFRTPREGPVAVGPSGLEGDAVGNPSVHGGARKTVYAYPSEHYPFWSEELDGVPLPWGSFGENLTTDGLREAELHPGDVLEIGDARLVVTQPRGPCFKLNLRFGRPDVLTRFLRAGRPGFYLSVARPGILRRHDPITVHHGATEAVSILEMFERARRDEG